MEISPLNRTSATPIADAIGQPLGQEGYLIALATSWGSSIDLSEIVKASRGATATYEEGLLDALAETLGKGQALACTPMAVVESDYKDQDDFRNAKQTNAAELRKHFNRLVELKKVPAGSKISINWNPETGVPQVSLNNK